MAIKVATTLDNNQLWQGRRYYPISQYFKQHFGERVGKISVSIAETCPNRSPNTDLEVCIFCDEWGSAAYPLEKDRELIEQIRHNKKMVARRLKSESFLAYFQSYTNTLGKVNVLAERYDLVLQEDYIKGLVIGTRPDCLPARLMPLLQSYCQRTYVLVELGIQSFYNDHLEFLRRGHSAEKNIEGILKLKQHTDVDIGVHLIFGLPNESEQRIIDTALMINQLPITNVKLHNLHVLKNTPLEKLYHEGKFEPLELEPYAEKVILFLRHLNPDIALQRLAALCSRWDELVAPAWTAQKMQPIDYIENQMKERGVMQGDLYDPHAKPLSLPIPTYSE